MAFRSNFSFGYALTPWVKRLLIANAVASIVVWLDPSDTLYGLLAFQPARLLYQPWTLITYMFLHGDFWHLFFNMLALFFFGPPLEERWGSREFLKYYLICGLGGAALSFAFDWHASIVGASGAIYGVMLAFALNWPNAPIYIWGIFPIKAKWLVGILVVLTLVGATGGARGVAHFAHLGGFAIGFLYLKLDWRISQFAGRWKKKLASRGRHRFTVISGDSGNARPPSSTSRTRRREEERLLDEVDRVLDKISKAGLASLSAEERRLLDEVSRRYRQN